MKKVKDYLVELSLIVLGVLIAISVDDYRERSKTDAMIQSYLKVMKRDLQENLKILDEEIFYDSVAIDRLILLRDKLMSANYTGIDTLTVYFFEHSSFNVNDTGFRMIVQSGNSHSIEPNKLAQLNDLFGAQMTNLSFFQSADASAQQLAGAFMVKHHTRVEALLKQQGAGFVTELLNLTVGRLITMTGEWQEKKKFREKALAIMRW